MAGLPSELIAGTSVEGLRSRLRLSYAVSIAVPHKNPARTTRRYPLEASSDAERVPADDSPRRLSRQAPTRIGSIAPSIPERPFGQYRRRAPWRCRIWWDCAKL